MPVCCGWPCTTTTASKKITHFVKKNKPYFYLILMMMMLCNVRNTTKTKHWTHMSTLRSNAKIKQPYIFSQLYYIVWRLYHNTIAYLLLNFPSSFSIVVGKPAHTLPASNFQQPLCNV